MNTGVRNHCKRQQNEHRATNSSQILTMISPLHDESRSICGANTAAGSGSAADVIIPPSLSEIMSHRWHTLLYLNLPPFDLSDLKDSITKLENEHRQNKAEVAHAVYMNCLSKECAIGDYVSLPNNSIKVSEEVRLCMVTVIVEVHHIKEYKEETLYMATSLADRYLALLTIF